MRIIFFDGKVLDCLRVEFCKLKPGFLLVDDSTLVDIEEVQCIVSRTYGKYALGSVYGKTCREGK